MKIVLQAEAAECSLACCAMVASAHGLSIDLLDLRQRFPTSLKGTTLTNLMSQLEALGFSSRPLRLEVDELRQLTLPCILHWDLNHLVVLKQVKRRHIVVADPAVGLRRVPLQEVSRRFTGVALEAHPTERFRPGNARPKLRLRQLTGRIRGLGSALGSIFVVAIVLELFALLAPLLNQVVVDDVIATGDRHLLTVVVLGFGLVLLVQSAVSFARSWMIMVLGQDVSLQWAGKVFAHLIRLPADFFEKRHLGDIVSRFSSVGSIQNALTTSIIEVSIDGLMAIAALGMMLAYSPALAAVTISAALAYGLLRGIAYGPLRRAAAERVVLGARESSHFLETLRAIVPIKLFGREAQRQAHWQNLVVDIQNRDVQTARLNILFSTSSMFIFGVENLVVFWLGAKAVMAGQSAAAPFTIGMLFAYIGYRGQFTGRIASLIDHAVQWKMLGVHAERLADIVLTPDERDAAGQPKAPQAVAVADLAHLPPTLELRNVSFRYGEGEAWVLRNANLHIAPGSFVALVGTSGCGKTTLLKILLGLLSPTEGQVLYGGVPVAELGPSNVRRQIGTVMQDDALLAGSLAHNISFFDPATDHQRVERCVRAARLKDDISRMPMGLQTLAGDLGSALSGGQRQRVLLARALYKEPRMLVLDEATSHLDTATEASVIGSLGQLGLTRLIVSHRPETISAAQRVLMLRDGQVAEMAEMAEMAGKPSAARSFFAAATIAPAALGWPTTPTQSGGT